MCVSLAPAKFSKTTLYIGEALKGNKLVHVLGYQNTAQNLSDVPQVLSSARRQRTDAFWESMMDELPGTTGNAMILPFPAAEEMTEENVIDTSGCKRILKDMASAIRPSTRGGALLSASYGAKSVRVFDTGIYTVVLATAPTLIPGVLNQVPEAKRPPLNEEVFEAYEKWYPGWQVALCCFNNSEAVEADPLMWWYEPKFPKGLFAPGLDSHTGGVPVLDSDVDVDHTIVLGSYRMGEKGYEVRYSDKSVPDATMALLPDRVIGESFGGSYRNGDFGFYVSDVHEGKFRMQRATPPGAR